MHKIAVYGTSFNFIDINNSSSYENQSTVLLINKFGEPKVKQWMYLTFTKWCSTSVFHHSDRGSIPGHVGAKFDLCIKVPLGSNRSFLWLLGVLNILYCYQSVPCAVVTSCLVARAHVDLSVCVCVCVHVCMCVCVCVCMRVWCSHVVM